MKPTTKITLILFFVALTNFFLVYAALYTKLVMSNLFIFLIFMGIIFIIMIFYTKLLYKISKKNINLVITISLLILLISLSIAIAFKINYNPSRFKERTCQSKGGVCRHKCEGGESQYFGVGLCENNPNKGQEGKCCLNATKVK